MLLQYCYFISGLFIKGTKKDLLARFRIYNAIGILEVIIYKEAIQVPKNSKLSKTKYCRWEIAHKLKFASLSQRAIGTARWGNLSGLFKLEIDWMFKLTAEIIAIKAEIPKLKSTYVNSLIIKNRFFSLFLRDYHLAQYTSNKYKNGRKLYSMIKIFTLKQMALV